MTTKLWKEKVREAYNNQLPFVCFSNPDSDTITVCIQKDANASTMVQFDDPAFILAPFGSDIDALCISFSQCEMFTVPISSVKEVIISSEVKENLKAKRAHLKRVEQAMKTIESGSLRKVVISREQEVQLKQFSVETLIDELFLRYNDAFQYIWYHPNTNLWCGATPEVLLKTDDLEFYTMALAGTKIYNEHYEPQWNRKELEEQHIVTEAIQKRLEKISSIYKISKTYNRRAGNVVHLCTDVRGILRKGHQDAYQVANALHPTPAVCGMPNDAAKKYIAEHEGYDREFYTGFVGLIGETKSHASFFVNLRCMKIEGKTATLYVGGGITHDSNPEDEWLETQNKLQTMLQVLEPMR